MAEQDWKYHGYKNVAFSGRRDEIQELTRAIAEEVRAESYAAKVEKQFDRFNGLREDSLPMTSQTNTADASGRLTLNRSRIASLGDRYRKGSLNPPKNITGATYYASSTFEGYITEVRSRTFVARVVDVKRDSSVPTEEIEFYLSDVDEQDVAKVSPGAIFRWVIGLERLQHGQRKRVSRFYFRPNLSVSSDSADKAMKEADEMLKFFGVT